MRTRMVAGCVAVALSAGCGRSKVQWEEPQSAPGDTLGILTIGSAGSVGFSRPVHAPAPPTDATMCEGSLVVAADGNRFFAAWLRLRPDSTVAVMSARLDDGRAWTTAAMVDSVDIGKHGCNRPGPSVAAAAGYVHVAYSMHAPEGFGVFFAHSMDQAATFHSPMTVVYGDRLSATSVDAFGMRVAVAYEDPNGRGKRVNVALSETQGHTFEPRERGSPDEMLATQPRIAIRDTLVAVSFGGGAGIGRAVRIGHIP